MKTIRVVAILVVFCIFIGISAFAGGSQEAEEEGPVSLRFPHWFFGHGGSFAEWINGAVDSFEAANPNVSVEREQVPFDQYWDKLDTAVAGGNAPDIAAFGPSKLGRYIEAGVLLPLNDLIDMDDINSNFSTLQTEDIPKAAPDGKTYGLAFDSGFYLPLYRPSVLKDAGVGSFAKNPDEFVEMAQKLTTSDRFGFAFMNMPGNWNEQSIDITIWSIAFGGHWGDAAGKPTLNSTEMVKAVSYLNKLHELKTVPRDTDKGTYRKMFGTGNVGTLIDGMWMYGLAVGWDPSAAKDFDAAAMPFSTQRVAAFYECNSITAASKHPEEAAALIQHLVNKEHMERLVRITQLIPPRTAVFSESLKRELVQDWPWYKEFIDHAQYGVLNSPSAMSGTLQTETLKILGHYFDRILFEDMDVKEALDAAQKEALALF